MKDKEFSTRYFDKLSHALRSLLNRRRRLVAGSALVAVMTMTQAQTAPPQHWVAYAQMTGNELQARLSDGPGDLVSRLHGWLEERQGSHAEPFSIVVRIWITQDGWVERSEFDSLGDVQADADLRALLSAKPLPEPPPPDMRQPMVLQLTLQANPDYHLDQEPKPAAPKLSDSIKT